MVNDSLPKVLIVSRGVWDDSKGTSSTLSNIFSDYNPDKLAQIYIETKTPNTKCCKKFFQISEISLLYKLLHWRTKAGKVIDITEAFVETNEKFAQNEDKLFSFIRKRRFYIFKLFREILWALNGWKSKELRSFILAFDPDVIWLDGSTEIFLNRLYKYVLEVAQKPSLFYFMDDNYTYKSVIGNHYLYRFFLRIITRQLVSKCDKLFVISPKMKREFDKEFGVDSILVTKSIDFSNLSFKNLEVHQPIRMAYLGQLIYGRIHSIIILAKALDTINLDEIKIQLSIYTNNFIPEKIRGKLICKNSVIFKNTVPYDKIHNVIGENDLLLFVESLNRKYNKDARLSFSTKITDYLSSGKCILAIGPDDSASIEYFKTEDAALVATKEVEILPLLQQLFSTNIIQEYAKKSYNTGFKNHEKAIMNAKVFKELSDLASNNKVKSNSCTM